MVFVATSVDRGKEERKEKRGKEYIEEIKKRGHGKDRKTEERPSKEGRYRYIITLRSWKDTENRYHALSLKFYIISIDVQSNTFPPISISGSPSSKGRVLGTPCNATSFGEAQRPRGKP